MAEGQGHHLFNDLNGISGCLIEAQANDRIHAGSMAFIADIVSVDTACFAVFFFVADRALHELVSFEIHKGRFADQTFFFHH